MNIKKLTAKKVSDSRRRVRDAQYGKSDTAWFCFVYGENGGEKQGHYYTNSYDDAMSDAKDLCLELHDEMDEWEFTVDIEKYICAEDGDFVYTGEKDTLKAYYQKGGRIMMG